MTDDPMTEALTRACIKLGDQAVRIEELEAELATVRLSLGGERDAWQRGAEIAQEKLAAAEARCAELERHARDMVREWRLHGQLTDSCRPMERVLGIHAPFCPVHLKGACECDLARAALAGGGE